MKTALKMRALLGSSRKVDLFCYLGVGGHAYTIGMPTRLVTSGWKMTAPRNLNSSEVCFGLK